MVMISNRKINEGSSAFVPSAFNSIISIRRPNHLSLLPVSPAIH
jgi:hypothetical protein